jgi:hypothetical protein
MLLWVAMVAANHGRSLHRPRPPRYLSDLTLYVPPLLTALGKLPIEALEALLLDVQPAREGVEAIEGSTLKPALELAIPGFSSPPQRQGNRTLLLGRPLRIEKFFRLHAQSSSQLTECAKVRASDLAGLDAGDRGGTQPGLLGQPRLSPHPQPTDIFHTLAYVGHSHTSSLSTAKAYHKLYGNSIIAVSMTKIL